MLVERNLITWSYENVIFYCCSGSKIAVINDDDVKILEI